MTRPRSPAVTQSSRSTSTARRPIGNSTKSDRAWVRKWYEALAPHSTGGVYINFVGDEGGQQVRAAYGENKLRTLAKLKAKFDPDNVFRVNQNIVPA